MFLLPLHCNFIRRTVARGTSQPKFEVEAQKRWIWIFDVVTIFVCLSICILGHEQIPDIITVRFFEAVIEVTAKRKEPRVTFGRSRVEVETQDAFAITTFDGFDDVICYSFTRINFVSL